MRSVILAGGSGTRLWPLSRRDFPKQFLKLPDGDSLLQKTVKLISHFADNHDICIVGNEHLSPLIENDLSEIQGSETINVLSEPAGRNTAPAIALALKYCMDCLKCELDEVVFISSSDALITPADAFADYIRRAERIAKAGRIVTLGVVPDKPATGYGYIKRGTLNSQDDHSFSIESFIEKPPLETAKIYLQSGNYFWNAGMFVFSIRTMLGEFKKYCPEIFRHFTKDYGTFVAHFAQMPNISIDFSVMEKSRECCVIPLTNIHWSDLGTWDTLSEMYETDDQKNSFTGDVLSIDTSNSFVLSEDKLVAIVGIEDCIVVNTKDATFIVKKGDSHKIKDIIDILKERKRKEL